MIKVILSILALILLIISCDDKHFFELKAKYSGELAGCKNNAKMIDNHGYFNICKKINLSGGFPADIAYKFIIYDSNDLGAKDYCLVDITKILETNFNIHMQQPVTNVIKLKKNYYIAIYSSGTPNSQKCGIN